jgi:hypothetical protein
LCFLSRDGQQFDRLCFLCYDVQQSIDTDTTMSLRTWNSTLERENLRIAIEFLDHFIHTSLEEQDDDDDEMSHVKCTRSMQVFKQPIAEQYINCAFLTNLVNCYYGTLTS